MKIFCYSRNSLSREWRWRTGKTVSCHEPPLMWYCVEGKTSRVSGLEVCRLWRFCSSSSNRLARCDIYIYIYTVQCTLYHSRKRNFINKLIVICFPRQYVLLADTYILGCCLWRRMKLKESVKLKNETLVKTAEISRLQFFRKEMCKFMEHFLLERHVPQNLFYHYELLDIKKQ